MTLTKESLREALDSYLFENDERRTVVTAARFVERLLPGECVNGQGDPNCHDGQVWDEELVEVVLDAVMQAIGGNRFPYDERPMKVTRAVLAALAEKVTE